jgi:alcohol dehydrogenase class IV
MEAFEYSALPARVIFGLGTLARVTDELIALGRKRAFVLSDPHHAPPAQRCFGIRAQSSGIRSEPFSTTHITAAGRLKQERK